MMRHILPIVFVAATVLVGCNSTSSVHTLTTAPTTAATTQKESREELEFLADIPSLKDVSLKMSEAEFVDILHQQKLDFTKGNEAGQTTYFVHPKVHVVVVFGFREGLCSGIQRLPD
jgi:hypothetical protein